MNNVPCEKLKYIITQYGRSISEDPKRCEALLRDLCGQYRKEINVLVSAAKEGIPADLSNSQNTVSSDLLLSRLTKRLEDRLGLTQESAKWAVESWALALGIVSERDKRVTEPSSSPPPVSPQYIQEKIISAIQSQPPTQIRISEPPTLQPVINPSDNNLDLEVQRKTRLKIANRKIKFGWIAGYISSGILFISALYTLRNIAIERGNMDGVDMNMILLVNSLAIGLAYGIQKKSRLCTLSMFIIHFYFSMLSLNDYFIRKLSNVDNLVVLLVCLILTCFYAVGLQGTIEHHRLKKCLNNS